MSSVFAALVLPVMLTGQTHPFTARTLGSVQPEDVEAVQRYAEESTKVVARFFKSSIPKPFEIVVCADRSTFDNELKAEYLTPDPQRWMVAAGMRRGLCILAPSRWKTDAADHDHASKDSVRRVVCHELVHVMHAQINPSNDFDGMDDLGWLIEGVAIFASGQLDKEHKGDDLAALKAKAVPDKLSAFFGGRYGYGISGSLVSFVDHRYGRKTLLGLLKLTKPDEVLGQLKISETALIENWKASLIRR